MVLSRFGLPAKPPIDEALSRIPANRDRLIDAVRAFAILIVVLGHGFLAIVAWSNGVPRAGNVLSAYPTGQLMTWVFQVMPLFFFAGGYANATSWEHRGDLDYAGWMWARTRRLLRPLWGYFLVMIPIALAIGIGAPSNISSPILVIATQLLWFLGIYLVVTAMTPLLVQMELRRHSVLVLGGLGLIALIDLARFNSVAGPVALLNFVLVWGVLTSLGMRYRRGLLTPRVGAALASGALLVNIVMVLVWEWYPRSMVGMPGDRFTNVAPPTLALTMHGFVVIGVVAMLAQPARTLMSGARVWRTTVLINMVMMTIYLWHLPALMALFIFERGIGFERPATIQTEIGPVPAAGFWVASIGHWIAFIALVVIAVRLLWPLEYLRIPIWDREQRGAPRAAGAWVAVGAVLTGVALLMLSATGLNLVPMRTINYASVPINSGVALALLVLGSALIKWAGAGATRVDWSN